MSQPTATTDPKPEEERIFHGSVNYILLENRYLLHPSKEQKRFAL
jgi:hypothetical protein